MQTQWRHLGHHLEQDNLPPLGGKRLPCIPEQFDLWRRRNMHSAHDSAQDLPAYEHLITAATNGCGSRLNQGGLVAGGPTASQLSE